MNIQEALKVIAEHARLHIAISADATASISMTLEPMGCALENFSNRCPMPLVLYQDNSRGVCVMDNTSCMIFTENFEDIPDEMNTNFRESYINKARALAHLLIAL